MFIKYVVKHYSQNRDIIYSAFAFDLWDNAINSFNKLCAVEDYQKTHDIISMYEFSYNDNELLHIFSVEL